MWKFNNKNYVEESKLNNKMNKEMFGLISDSKWSNIFGNSKQVLHLVNRREKISRKEADRRTKLLVEKFLGEGTDKNKIKRLKQLIFHIQEYTKARKHALSNYSFYESLVNYSTTHKNKEMRETARMCMALCGFPPQLNSDGIKILSIDGGGARGIFVFEILKAIEEKTGKKIYEIFDLVCGVSAGSLIVLDLVLNKTNVIDSREKYFHTIINLLSIDSITGMRGMLSGASYYNENLRRKLIKDIYGDKLTMGETSKFEGIPRIALISTIVNSPYLQPYVFRNYETPTERGSEYKGGTQDKVCEAAAATSAIPLFMEEVKIGNFVHQDGGLVASNPSAIAIHEARRLWPDEQIQCIVSCGTSKSIMDTEIFQINENNYTSIRNRLRKYSWALTDKSAVAYVLQDLLPNIHYRFNPYTKKTYDVFENDPLVIREMIKESELYVRRNQKKVDDCCECLMRKPSIIKSIKRDIKNKLRQLRIIDYNFVDKLSK
uniref:PNPLA domain-containing protein n=1 Tax=Parastrongyloides trichosuri TaxID=131310 RepID=A0A0N4ZU60_PARTI